MSMKISYVTTYDALDVGNWSGLGYNIAEALKKHNKEIDYIGNLKRPFNLNILLKKIYQKGTGKGDLGDRIPFVAKHYSIQAEKRLKDDTDIIFSPGTLPLAYMENKVPKVFYTDATFAGMVNYYPEYSNFSKQTIIVGNRLEQRALDNCAMAIYSSDWAAETALRHYKINSKKIEVVPFGANLSSQKSLSEITHIVQNRSKRKCKLLFLSVDWERKGGIVALKIAEALNKMGIETELHIAGINEIPLAEIPAFVKNHGFLSKSSLADKSMLEQLISDCHFLLLPTKADCSPVVLCEASSLGLPSLSTKIGGIPSIIRDNINGKTFSITAEPEDYANYIKNSFCDFSIYQKFCYSSFMEYQNRLNWDISGKKIINLLEGILSVSVQNIKGLQQAV